MGSVERNGDPVHTEPYTEKSGEPQRIGARERGFTIPAFRNLDAAGPPGSFPGQRCGRGSLTGTG